MKTYKTLSSLMSDLGKSKSDKKIAASLKNLERANKAKKNIFAMAKRRKANPQEMKIVLIKAAKLWKGEQK